MVSLVWMDEFAFVGMDGMATLTWMEQWMNGVVVWMDAFACVGDSLHVVCLPPQ